MDLSNYSGSLSLLLQQMEVEPSLKDNLPSEAGETYYRAREQFPKPSPPESLKLSRAGDVTKEPRSFGMTESEAKHRLGRVIAFILSLANETYPDAGADNTEPKP